MYSVQMYVKVEGVKKRGWEGELQKINGRYVGQFDSAGDN